MNKFIVRTHTGRYVVATASHARAVDDIQKATVFDTYIPSDVKTAMFKAGYDRWVESVPVRITIGLIEDHPLVSVHKNPAMDSVGELFINQQKDSDGN